MFTFEFDHFDWLWQFYSEWRQTSKFVNFQDFCYGPLIWWLKIPEVASYPSDHFFNRNYVEIQWKSFFTIRFFPKQNFQFTSELYLCVYQRINKINEMTMRRFLSVPLILLIFSLNINWQNNLTGYNTKKIVLTLEKIRHLKWLKYCTCVTWNLC